MKSPHSNIAEPKRAWERRWNAGKDITFRNATDGTMLVADDGFDCIPKGALRMVHVDHRMRVGGKKYVVCKSGQHFLDGQHDHKGGSNYIVGFRKAA